MTELEKLLAVAWQLKASDLHISVGQQARLRVDGELLPPQAPFWTAQETEKALRTLMTLAASKAGMARQPLSFTAREYDFAVTAAAGRCRVSAFRENNGWALALRFLPEALAESEELGLPLLARRFTALRQGLLLLTGATGSGKSTTLAALVRQINRERACHIITLEDPIEYFYPLGCGLVQQRQIGRDTASFAAGLRSALRQDPDVLVLGELRDAEAMAVMLNAATTGHFCLTTLHTSDAVQAVERILDALGGTEAVRAQLANSLVGIICQRLLPRRDGKGRVALFEVLTMTAALRQLIRTGELQQLPSYMETGAQHGMLTFAASEEKLKRQGLI